MQKKAVVKIDMHVVCTVIETQSLDINTIIIIIIIIIHI
jgi:hypothetical protein